jgi:hypothetical protein
VSGSRVNDLRIRFPLLVLYAVSPPPLPLLAPAPAAAGCGVWSWVTVVPLPLLSPEDVWMILVPPAWLPLPWVVLRMQGPALQAALPLVARLTLWLMTGLLVMVLGGGPMWQLAGSTEQGGGRGGGGLGGGHLQAAGQCVLPVQVAADHGGAPAAGARVQQPGQPEQRFRAGCRDADPAVTPGAGQRAIPCLPTRPGRPRRG